MLTRRERQVADLLAMGHTCREIGIAFGLSVKTIDHHRIAVMRKLKLRNNVDLARFAIAAGWVPAPRLVSDGVLPSSALEEQKGKEL